MKVCFLVIMMIVALLSNAGTKSQNIDSLFNDFSGERCVAALANHYSADINNERSGQSQYEAEILKNARMRDLCIGAAFFVGVVGLDRKSVV